MDYKRRSHCLALARAVIDYFMSLALEDRRDQCTGKQWKKIMKRFDVTAKAVLLREAGANRGWECAPCAAATCPSQKKSWRPTNWMQVGKPDFLDGFKGCACPGTKMCKVSFWKPEGNREMAMCPCEKCVDVKAAYRTKNVYAVHKWKAPKAADGTSLPSKIHAYWFVPNITFLDPVKETIKAAKAAAKAALAAAKTAAKEAVAAEKAAIVCDAKLAAAQQKNAPQTARGKRAHPTAKATAVRDESEESPEKRQRGEREAVYYDNRGSSPIDTDQVLFNYQWSVAYDGDMSVAYDGDMFYCPTAAIDELTPQKTSSTVMLTSTAFTDRVNCFTDQVPPLDPCQDSEGSFRNLSQRDTNY